MIFDPYTRKDFSNVMWRTFGDQAKAVRTRLVPGSRFITVVFELKEPIEVDEPMLLTVEDWTQYEERRLPPPSTDKLLHTKP